MKLSNFIKLTLSIGVSLFASITLASAYSSYSPIVNSKQLSVIITITIFLGLASLYQKRT
ncbi:hypothetical protein N9400_01135 [Candidatus Thioglobus sp.]|nr:hypothetical protein [Candidatus Thioglobus sp.]